MGSLQDALLKVGLADEEQQNKKPRRGKPGAAPKRKAQANKGAPRNNNKKKHQHKPDAESDLARAYAARQREEKRQKEEDKKRRVAEQEERRRRNLELDRIIKGNTLNRKDAEVPRYFEHLGRIRRVLCTPEQREQLNKGDIGVINLRGSYLLVSLETLEEYRKVAPDLVPSLEGREEPEDDGSHYPPVPDDLIW